MRARNIINVFAAFIFVIATATAVSAQTGAPTVTRPTSSAVSPNLSDLPTAHWAQGQNLKMVPAPKPLPPRGAGPGGTSPHDGALQHEEGPRLPVDSKTKFGGIGASGYIPPDPNIAVGKTANDLMAMINHGSSPAAVCFTVSNDGNFLPADLDGATPPADGTPGYFLNFEPTSSLRLYQLSPNFPLPPTPQPEL